MVAAIAALVLAVSGSSSANERRFAYTYESAVLPEGERQIALWSTQRIGKERFYAAFDQRLHFEVGAAPRLMVALHLDAEQERRTVGTELQSISRFTGLSAEARYQFTDREQAAGIAVDGEVIAAPDALEVEGRAIFDKQSDRLLVSGNAVLRPAWRFVAPGEVRWDLTAEVVLGGLLFFGERFSVGPEFRATNLFDADGLEHSGLFLGPTVAYAAPGWWVVVTGQTQLPTLKRPEGSPSPLDLVAYEKFVGRVIFALRL